MGQKIPYFSGSVVLLSNLSIEEVGNILSDRLFGGLPFGGKEQCLYEEVPAIFIEPFILGFNIILSGYGGFGEDEGYVLETRQDKKFSIDYVQSSHYRLDGYLYLLVKDALKDISEIVVERARTIDWVTGGWQW